MPAQHHAALFRDLHGPGRLLLLPNAWDAGSARLLAEFGASAVATSSAALAWAHGYPDGESLPRDTLVAAVAEITRAVDLPVTVDTERGFGANPAEVGETIARLIGVGAVGINIEDGAAPPAELAARITAVRARAEREGVNLFINARTDLWLKPIVEPERRVAEAIGRAGLYRDAGADAFFVPRLSDLDEIGRLVPHVDLPVNLMAVPACRPGGAAKAGIRRVSLGVVPLLKAYGALRDPVRAFLDRATSSRCSRVPRVSPRSTACSPDLEPARPDAD